MLISALWRGVYTTSKNKTPSARCQHAIFFANTAKAVLVLAFQQHLCAFIVNKKDLLVKSGDDFIAARRGDGEFDWLNRWAIMPAQEEAKNDE